MSTSIEFDTANAKYILAPENAHIGRSHTTPKRSNGLENGNINDSDDFNSPLSGTPNTFALADGVSIEFKSNPSLSTNDEKQEALLREDIILTVLERPMKQRHKHMPDCFDKKGRLFKQFKRFGDDIRKAKEARQAIRRQQSLNIEASLKPVIPDRANKRSKRPEDKKAEANPTAVLNIKSNQQQSEQEDQSVQNEEVIVPNRRQPPIDTAGINCQQCRSSGQNCQNFVDVTVGLTCLSCFNAGEKCSLSMTRRELRKAKANTASISEINSKPQSPFEEQANPKPQALSQLQPRRKADAQSRSQKQSRRSIKRESASRDASQLRRPSRISKPQTLNRTTIDTNVPPHLSTNTTSSELAGNTSALLSNSTGTTSVDILALRRDFQVAAETVHKTLQRQIARVTNSCDTCLDSPCLCEPSQQPLEDILCNGKSCFKKRFSHDYLEKYLGIPLSDAHDFRLKYGFWCCPECSYKKTIEDSRGPNVFASPHILPRFGSDFPPFDQISGSFDELWGLIGSEICMAKKNAAPPSMRMLPLLQIPCIRDEVSDERSSPLMHALRRILRVDPGILVKEVVISSQLQDLEPSVWMRVVMVFLFFEFVFKTPSPFDDVAIWRKGLVHSFSPDLAERLVQDNHIRTMEENTGAYQVRREDQRDKHVKQLNAAMMPLIGGVGGNEAIHRTHMRIADIAGDLNATFSAYTGTFEAIMPGIGDRFDLNINVSDYPMDEFKDLSGRHILLTTMVGVRWRLPGKEWRNCSKAKVRLWPSSDQAPTSPSISLPCASGSLGERSGSKKRTYHDLTSS